MNDDWLTSAAARRILVHWTDPRPAWLWSQDGTTLLWRNHAARFFGARMKKSGLRLAPQPTPIRGQVARLIRLGSPGRSSLSRMQFLAGGRPVAATTIVTPLDDAAGRPIALVVGVDAMAAEILAQATDDDPAATAALLPRDADYVVAESDGTILEASAGAAERFGRVGRDSDTVSIGEERFDVVRYTAGPQGEQLIVFRRAGETRSIAEIRAEDGLSAHDVQDEPSDLPDEPVLPGLPEPEPAPEPEAESIRETADAAARPAPDAPIVEGRLSSLFDRLADTDALYAGLPKAAAADETTAPPGEQVEGREPRQDVAGPAVAPASDDAAEPPRPPAAAPPSPPDLRPAVVPDAPDVIAAVIEFEDDLAAERPVGVSFRVTGRGFFPAAAATPPADEPGSIEDVERASRYNFSELSRILSDRVAADLPPAGPGDDMEPPAGSVPPVPAGAQDGALINIAGETFILNRLPLGILVFRDQQVLFANRALTDLLGYGTIDGLRDAGLLSIFPTDDPATAGPVTHLVRRDGAVMPVTARLQSVTWQGRPAVMLSAMRAEQHLAHEIAVRSFAAALAELRDEGYVALDRAGLLADLSPRAATLLGRAAKSGASIAALLDAEAAQQLRGFLERPARFAETTRPSIVLPGPDGGTITLFAEGVAGIVNGYFGIVAPASPSTAGPKESGSEEPLMLARVSRGVRRPLNTIIGFADLIRSAAFGTIENQRYLEYARDIKTAGQEIAVLVDELDDYARLRTGTFSVRPAELDLGGLLESCIVRVRGQANAARVLVRSAISEGLPRIRADRASLGQAVLNLLASAIDQTPPSGSVILSAQNDDAGGVAINIRDSGEAGVDPGERFVVFRDGVGKDGETLAPVRSSVGLALTRSLIAVNACTLTVAAAGAVGTIFSVNVPPDLVGPAAARTSR